jgi:hypothetical protein
MRPSSVVHTSRSCTALIVMSSLLVRLCRVAACVAELTKLDLDVRSTAAYGVAHILCALTVTNRELRAAALADKDITPEQYEQMQELQRIKTKDEDGNVIEEKKVRIRESAAIISHEMAPALIACERLRQF